jgi:hypothetical protein
MNKLAAFLGAIILLALFIAYRHELQPFDAAKWESDHLDRSLMAQDLVKRQLLLGKSKLQVQALVGPPSFCFDVHGHRLNGALEPRCANSDVYLYEYQLALTSLYVRFEGNPQAVKWCRLSPRWVYHQFGMR